MVAGNNSPFPILHCVKGRIVILLIYSQGRICLIERQLECNFKERERAYLEEIFFYKSLYQEALLYPQKNIRYFPHSIDHPRSSKPLELLEPLTMQLGRAGKVGEERKGTGKILIPNPVLC